MSSSSSRRTHHRSRSSVDRVLDLLAELDEQQMEILLREAESTVSGNIPVSKGIDLFSQKITTFPSSPNYPPPPPPRRQFLTSLSPRKQLELRRRHSKRASVQQQQLLENVKEDGNNNTATTNHPPTISISTTTTTTTTSKTKTPRSYKRISRPVFSSSLADLADLLAAYLSSNPNPNPNPNTLSSASSSTTLSSSPATPRTPIPISFSFPPEPEPEPEPELDLLEPTPRPTPAAISSIFGAGSNNPAKRPVRKISGIFEVLDDAGSV
ncbi:hypothetical protein GGS20DRAFT_536574 [Poronia punctata]|nr:hypothetical protein GGS20DRAFT_536574 [Poronia punctata]